MRVEPALDKVISALLFGGWLLLMSGGMALANKSPEATASAVNAAGVIALTGGVAALLGILMIPLYIIVPRNAEINLPSIKVEW